MLRGCNSKKSYGLDELQMYAINRFNNINVRHITKIFNHCLAIGHYPSGWKKALVTAIPKHGKDKSVISNISDQYRNSHQSQSCLRRSSESVFWTTWMFISYTTGRLLKQQALQSILNYIFTEKVQNSCGCKNQKDSWDLLPTEKCVED